MRKDITIEEVMGNGIIIMFVLMFGMLVLVSAITKQDESTVLTPKNTLVEDPCKTTSSINNCIVIGADR